MNTLRLALRMLARDWRAGELTVLALALILAVAALTSVSFLADRVERRLVLESHQLLGGDLLLSADHRWPDEVRQEAQARGLQVAESLSFPSMVSGPAGTALAEIKAVSDNYPLRGRLRTAPALDAGDAEVDGVPAPGNVWLEDRLARTVSPATGSRLRLGRLEPDFRAVLTRDPERGVNVFSLAPRLLINLADVPATELIQPASRVAWRLHFAGEPEAVEGFRQWITPRLGRGERLESLDNARPEMRTLMERAGRFLRLAAMLTIVLSAVAVALATDRYLRRHLDGCAVMRCLGATQTQLLAIHVGEFVLCGILAIVVGSVAGFGAQWGMQQMLAGLLSADLPAPGWRPWVHGAAVGMTLVIGFVVPPILRLRRVSTLRVLRREYDAVEPAFVVAYGFGALLLGALMVWVAGEARLGMVVLAGFALAFVIYGLLARLLVWALGFLRGRRWHGLANLRRRWRSTVMQAVALGLGLTTLLLLSVARGDLLASWRGQVPADAPNRFVINLQPDQRAAFTDFLVGHGLAEPNLEPMVRARLVAVNGRPVRPADYEDDRARRLVEREFNLSWSVDLPAGNTIVAGQWHGSDRQLQYSVEQGLAETLGLRLGDELTYDFAGVPVSAPVTSLRKLQWDSMRVNFFVIASPGMLDAFPESYITSFHLPEGQAGMVTELMTRLPNLTVIDVASVMRQLQDAMDQAARAVQALFAFSIAAGIVVLVAALQAGADERYRELAVMRALGARRRQLQAALMAEFAVLGTMAGLLAGLGSGAIAWALAHFALHLPYRPDGSLLLVGLATGLPGVVATGMWVTRGALRRPITADLLAN